MVSIILKIWEAIKVLFLFLFAPKGFIKHEGSLEDNHDKHGVYILRRAFYYSLLLIFISGVMGFTIGIILSIVYPNPRSTYIISSQIIAVLLLLWATLAVRGWDIQTWGGNTLTEKVNQWIYRTLYIIGTTILVVSMTWK